MTNELIITNTDGIIRRVAPETVELVQEINDPAVLTCKFTSGLSVYSLDTSSNPVRINSEVKLSRNGVQEFEGNIVSISEELNGEGVWEITVVANDKLWQGRGTKASVSGNTTWEVSTPTADSTSSISNADAKPYIRYPHCGKPWNIFSSDFFPYIDNTDWDDSNAVWLPLGYTSSDWEGYPSVPLSDTVYDTLIWGGIYSATITLDVPNSEAIITCDITGKTEVEKEVIEGEYVLIDGTGRYDYAPYRVKIGSRSVTGTTLTFRIEDITTIPSATVDFRPLTIKLDTSAGGIPPARYGLLDDEVILYDGYDADDSGIWTLQSVHRKTLEELTLSNNGKHYLNNKYDASISGGNVLITNGDEYDITVSQNALFPPGATVQFDVDGYTADYTIATSSWNGTTNTTTITLTSTPPVGLTKVQTRNRFIAIRPQKIAPGEFRFEGLADSQWNLVKEAQYSIDYENGMINTTLIPSILGMCLRNT